MIFNYYATWRPPTPRRVRTGMLNHRCWSPRARRVVGAIAPWNVPLFIAAAKLRRRWPRLHRRLQAGPRTPSTRSVWPRFRGRGLPRACSPSYRRAVSQRAPGQAPRIDKISFTGSGVGGKRIGGLCGERLKRCTLELAQVAAIILDDADLATPSRRCCRTHHEQRQACIARPYSGARSRYAEVSTPWFRRRGHEGGRPHGPGDRVGPWWRSGNGAGSRVSRQRARRGRHGRIGRRPPSGSDFAKGWYVEPTVFSDVDNK